MPENNSGKKSGFYSFKLTKPLIVVAIGFVGLIILVVRYSSKPYVPYQPNAAEVIKSSDIQTIPYEVIYTLSNKRFDKGKNFYLLIQPVNLSDKKFKDDIKLIVKKMVEIYGPKTTIDIYDSREALDIIYQQYGIQTLGRTRTSMEDKVISQHEVASFSGDLTTEQYLNTLRFFPNATTSTSQVGKYVETIEFNP